MKNKVIVITGAASGLGKSIALELGAKGNKIIILDILKKQGEALVKLINESKGDAVFFQVDLSNASQIKKIFKNINSAFKVIDVLINNDWTKMTQDELQIGSDGFAFESGLYETMRTMDFKLVFLQPHLDRLFSTAQKIELKIQHSVIEITEMLERVINNFPDPNQRIRILTVPGKLIVYTSHLNLDPVIYKGVNAITVVARRDTPEVKTTNYHACLSASNKANDANCFDAILCDKEGNIYISADKKGIYKLSFVHFRN